MENTHNVYNSFYTSSQQLSFGSDFGSDTEDLKNEKELLQKTCPYVENISNYQNYKTTIAKKILIYNCSDLTESNVINFVEQSKKLVKEVIKEQIRLKTSEVYHIFASEQNPALFILPDSVLITAEKVGEGTQSSVFRVNKISSEGSLVSKKIVKQSKISYASEFALLHSLKAESLNTPYIDHIQAYYLVKNQNMHLAIFENSDADLAHVNFNKVASPLEFIIRQVSQIAEGIRILHENNIVHRDIKGENYLINYEGVGKITDTGSAQQIPLDKESHNIYCTPYYAPPFIWNTFDDQFHKKGYQGKDADVFSTGMTLEFDCIIPLLTH
nr:protein kinase [Nitrosopumilus sp.]